MNAKELGGQPAYPAAMPDFIEHPVHGWVHREQLGLGGAQGMTKRELFALAAAHASLASPELMRVVTASAIGDGTAFQRCAAKAREMADALLAELAKEPTP